MTVEPIYLLEMGGEEFTSLRFIASILRFVEIVLIDEVATFLKVFDVDSSSKRERVGEA